MRQGIEARVVVGGGPLSAPEAPWKARAGGRARRHSSNRSARWPGCWCHSGRTCAPAVAAERTRTAARPAAWVPRSRAAARWPVRVGRTPLAAKRTAAPPKGWAAGAVCVPGAAYATGLAERQARDLAGASARRRPPRLKSGDSRSPDRTSATPGFLCRSGYTSPTIAQSLVPRFHYFKQGAE